MRLSLTTGKCFASTCGYVPALLVRCAVSVWLSASLATAREPTVALHIPISSSMPVITADTKIGGSWHVMLVDTGAGASMLDLSLKDLAQIDADQVVITTSSGEELRGNYYVVPTLQVQALTFDDVKVPIVDLESISSLYGFRFAGALGMKELSSGGKISLNYEQGFLDVHQGAWYLESADACEVNLDITQDIPVIHTKIAGHSVEIAIDTGANSCVSLPSYLFERLIKEGFIEVQETSSTSLSLSGSQSNRQGWFMKGELMGRSLAGMSVDTSPKRGMLGLEWLCGFNVEIDFPDRKLRYQPLPTTKPPISVELMTGAIFSYEAAGARVERLRPGGGAIEAAGVQQGDLIQRFDSLTADKLNIISVSEIVASKENQAIEINYLRKIDGVSVTTQLKLPKTVSAWDFAGKRNSDAQQ